MFIVNLKTVFESRQHLSTYTSFVMCILIKDLFIKLVWSSSS